MKTIPYADGSESFIYEAGDRVILKDYPENWIAKSGDHATVIRPQGYSHPQIDFLVVRTDAMVAGNWGTLTVPPWQLTPEDQAIRTPK